jgi:hypothetical protein
VQLPCPWTFRAAALDVRRRQDHQRPIESPLSQRYGTRGDRKRFRKASSKVNCSAHYVLNWKNFSVIRDACKNLYTNVLQVSL